MKKASLWGAFFVCVFCSLAAQAFCPAPAQLQSVAVARVVDGDTLRLVDGRSVRLIGLNAPEMAGKGRSAEPFAEAARRRLQALVEASRGSVGLQAGAEPSDRYGRVLAHAYGADGANLEAALLAEGLGYFVAIAPNAALADCHQAAEQHARHAALGLWRRPALQPASRLQRAGFALLDGRVKGFERNRGGVWLDLDGSVVLHIPPQALSEFSESFLRDLPGRAIEVRGWVVDRQGRSARGDQARWMLRITHPAMLVVRP